MRKRLRKHDSEIFRPSPMRPQGIEIEYRCLPYYIALFLDLFVSSCRQHGDEKLNIRAGRIPVNCSSEYLNSDLSPFAAGFWPQTQIIRCSRELRANTLVRISEQVKQCSQESQWPTLKHDQSLQFHRLPTHLTRYTNARSTGTSISGPTVAANAWSL
jgi:hypothetical protein